MNTIKKVLIVMCYLATIQQSIAQSNQNFNLQNTTATLSITSPVGGETWAIGSVKRITWTSTGVSFIKIEYSTSGGVSWNNINSSVSASTGYYDWTVINNASNSCKIRLTDVATNIYSQSTNNFTISILPYTITLTANTSSGGTVTGGGTYNSGSTVTVSATTKTGYDFQNWTENGQVVSTSASYTFVIGSSRNLVANFVVKQYTIQTINNPTIGGNTSGWGTYYHGTNISIKAKPNKGYYFKNWTENNTQLTVDTIYSFTVTAQRTFTANFSPILYTVQTYNEPSIGGSTTGWGTYNYGSSVTVKAIPNTGFYFKDWTENGVVISTEPTYTFTVNADRNLKANFTAALHTIQLLNNPSEGGSSTGWGTYGTGTQIVLSATPSPGYYFTNWTENGQVVSWDANYPITVVSSKIYTANFTKNLYNIVLINKPTLGGNTTGWGTYGYGTSVTLKATANKGYYFVNWSENGSQISTDPNYTFTVTSNRTITANFTASLYTVATISNPIDGGTTEGWGTYSTGTILTVKASPSNGFTFQNWTENGVVVSWEKDYSFLVDGPRNLTANFAKKLFPVVTNSNPDIGGKTVGWGTYGYGDLVTVEAIPSEGYYFQNWTENAQILSVNPKYSFIHTVSKNLTANFSLHLYTIKTSSEPNSGGSTSGWGTYKHGDKVILTAIAFPNYYFSNWSENGNIVSYESDYTFYAKGERELVAKFLPIMLNVLITNNPAVGGNCTGWGTYQQGTNVNLEAQPNEGYRFVNWVENGSILSTNKNYSFTLNTNRNIIANFEAISYSIKLTSEPYGGGTYSGEGSYTFGSSATVSAKANTGFQFFSWTEDGKLVSTATDYLFTVTKNRNLVANFQPKSIRLSYYQAAGNLNNVNSYKLFGVPGNADYSISQILKGKQGTDWQVFIDNGNETNYYEIFDNSEKFFLRPGRGFWVISKEPIELNLNVNSTLIVDGDNYSIPLQKGWNIISDPFDKKISWDLIKSRNNITENIWHFNETFSVSSILEPYNAFYFYNATNLSSLKIPYMTSLGKTYEGQNDENYVKIKLSLENSVVDEVRLGFHETGTKYYDLTDNMKPCSKFEKHGIAILCKDSSKNPKILFTDNRVLEENNEYELSIKVQPNKTYQLNIVNSEKYQDFGFLLVDQKLNKIYTCVNNQIKFSSSHHDNNFKLLFTKKNSLEKIINDFKLPTEYSVEQNYPNPFNPITYIKYHLPVGSSISLIIYNSIGEKIEELVKAYQEAGIHEILFDASKYVSGVYYYKIEASSVNGKTFKDVKKMVLIK